MILNSDSQAPRSPDHWVVCTTHFLLPGQNSFSIDAFLAILRQNCGLSVSRSLQFECLLSKIPVCWGREPNINALWPMMHCNVVLENHRALFLMISAAGCLGLDCPLCQSLLCDKPILLGPSSYQGGLWGEIRNDAAIDVCIIWMNIQLMSDDTSFGVTSFQELREVMFLLCQMTKLFWINSLRAD